MVSTRMGVPNYCLFIDRSKEPSKPLHGYCTVHVDNLLHNIMYI